VEPSDFADLKAQRAVPACGQEKRAAKWKGRGSLCLYSLFVSDDGERQKRNSVLASPLAIRTNSIPSSFSANRLTSSSQQNSMGQPPSQSRMSVITFILRFFLYSRQ